MTEKTKKINRLNGLSAYLSGPIDFAPDKGVGWREQISPFLKSMSIKVLNPLSHHDIFHGAENVDNVKRPYMQKLLEEERYDELREEMRELCHYDLRAVDLASFMIVNYDTSIHMCGTIEEISIGSNQVKPVLLVCKNGKKKLPFWLYGRLPHEHFFETWEELKNYLVKIDSDPNYKMSRVEEKRWLFMAGEHHNCS